MSGSLWLLGSSLFFYSFWRVEYLPLLLVSIIVNYGSSRLLSRTGDRIGPISKRAFLVTAIGFNLVLLGTFKYADFVIANFSAVTGVVVEPLDIVLPLAISYFTFQQIGYLVDSSRGETRDHGWLEYGIFVSFFPQLIVGPIVNHKDIVHQLRDPQNKLPDYRKLATGLFVLAVGLFKKSVLADRLSVYAEGGFSDLASLSTAEAWLVSLAGNFQIYFDFSGYTDMAIGSALLFGLQLPENFRSPFAATNIQDHWRRWHMTLSRFFLTYVYIPLGGSRKGELRKLTFILVIFLLSGLWHGAAWTFVFWGLLHGVGLVTFKMWEKVGIRLPLLVAWTR